MKLVIKAWRESIRVLVKYPRLFIPFIVTATVNYAMLYLVYLMPQRPVAYVLAPPVRVFFGEKFLHYPFNLFIMPRLFYYGGILISATIGVLMIAVAIGMLKNIYLNNKSAASASLAFSFKRYFALLGIWLITFLLSFAFVKVVKHFHYSGIILNLLPYLAYIGVVIIQLFFIYAVPALIIERRNILVSLLRGFIFVKKHFISSVLLLFLPALLYLPIVMLKQHIPGLIRHFYPEIIIVVLSGEIFVSLIVDILTTIPIAIVFLRNRQSE